SPTSSSSELNAWRAAVSGHAEAGRRERRHEGAVGEPLVVEGRLVRKRRLAGEAGHVREHLGHGDRKAEVDEWLGELPVADAEGPVAGHAGEGSLAGLDDTQVVQARDLAGRACRRA